LKLGEQMCSFSCTICYSPLDT